VSQSEREEIARADLKTGETKDWASTARFIGRGYQWIDRAAGVLARTGEELLAAAADDSP
jgi:hypothetical protein